MIPGSSLFGQLLAHFPRTEFARLVKKHEAERGAKGFTCWGHFVAMLFRQVAQADSLRVICNGLRCCLGKLAHLGLREAPNRSTLSYANGRRPAALFEELFHATPDRFRRHGGLGPRQKTFRFKNERLSLDSTTIGAIYKDRWQIEVFFRTLKQNLKIKTFVGATENALCIQIWTALIAMVLLKWMHHLSKASWSLSNLTAMLRLNLTTYRPLLDWLNDPFGQLNA